MKKNRTKMKPIRWLSLAALLMAAPIVSFAQDVPAAINYQGKLSDTLGNALSSGYYEIQFRVWDDPTQNGAGNLVWARSFPLHVIEGGLFNILLSNDGGQITSPGTPKFNDILEAFGGDDRYLGLTITVSNGVNVASSEISPRQQIASAAYAIQTQTANQVRDMGVTTEALGDDSVTAEKIASEAVGTTEIADDAVTSAKILNGAVTTPDIADGAVTVDKLKIDSDLSLNGHNLFLTDDNNSGVQHHTSFGGETQLDGPVLFGNTSGALGTSSGGQKVALTWDSLGAASLFGAPIDVSASHYPTEGGQKVRLRALTDGLIMNYNYAQVVYIQIYEGGSKPLFPGYSTNSDNSDRPPGDGYGMEFHSEGAGYVFGKQFMWPLRKGDEIQIYLKRTWSTAIEAKLYFVPIGKGVGNSVSDVMQLVSQ